MSLAGAALPPHGISAVFRDMIDVAVQHSAYSRAVLSVVRNDPCYWEA